MQLSLFDQPETQHPLSRQSDPAGSFVAAAKYAASGRFKGDKQLVYEALRREPQPITSKELARKMNADRHMLAKRLPDLERLGKAKRVGQDPQTKETLWVACN